MSFLFLLLLCSCVVLKVTMNTAFYCKRRSFLNSIFESDVQQIISKNILNLFDKECNFEDNWKIDDTTIFIFPWHIVQRYSKFKHQENYLYLKIIGKVLIASAY